MPTVGLTGSTTVRQRVSGTQTHITRSRPPPTRTGFMVDTPAVGLTGSATAGQRHTQTHITPGLPPETVDRLWLSGAGGAVVV
jgi:hypothetical protein